MYKRVGISSVEVHDRLGKYLISVCKRTKKGLTDAFERGKKTFQFSDLLVLKDQAFNAVKRDAVF